jgi:hypothetical protein
MNKLAYKIGSGVAAAALLAVSAVPAAFAATDVSVYGNGAFSDNAVRVSNNNSTSVRQTNNTNISNNVTTRQNTGGNSSSFNTGGGSSIFTGDATSDVMITNSAGANIASVPSYSYDNGSGSIVLAGNGAFSDNAVRYTNSNRTNYSQNNNSTLRNSVNSNQSTGHNNSGFNTGGYLFGGGDNYLQSGSSDSMVHLFNQAGFNQLY